MLKERLELVDVDVGDEKKGLSSQFPSRSLSPISVPSLQSGPVSRFKLYSQTSYYSALLLPVTPEYRIIRA